MHLRATLMIHTVTRHLHGETLMARPVASSPDQSGFDADNSYAVGTPSGELTLEITNPALVGKFAPGDVYHVDLSLAG